MNITLFVKTRLEKIGEDWIEVPDRFYVQRDDGTVPTTIFPMTQLWEGALAVVQAFVAAAFRYVPDHVGGDEAEDDFHAEAG